MLTQADFDALPIIEPVYPLTAGIAAKTLMKAVYAGLGAIPELGMAGCGLGGAQNWLPWHAAMCADASAGKWRCAVANASGAGKAGL